ncbi:MAG: flagellar hook-basal body complex protein [Thermodesulfobacteriota bacterium]
MAISSSLYSSISGLSTMGEAMSVLGDNVANLNTLAFKASRSSFEDVLAQSVSTAAGSAQVGRGVTLSTVEGLFAQGSFESSSSATDMAIGGQGFFILRAPDTAEANLYTRAGEFRFDQQGNLVSPVGYRVQGWQIDQTTGERQGTIGDITIGKSTPPVETTNMEVIFNLNSDTAQEENETRLFDAWDGTNAASPTPTNPIAPNEYGYTTAVKVYDAKGASHDITVYFDTTTQENVWEFLVTCDPAEDKRNLTAEQQTVYAPDITYNYENHKGAGALLYGTIRFSTSGDIDQIMAWDVPPDGKVDPAQNTNRKTLSTGESYYQFSVNFTGNLDANDPNLGNQMIDLNFGAKYGGQSSLQKQIVVSDAGGLDSTTTGTFVTKETLWGSVFDSGGNQLQSGDTFIVEGFDHNGHRLNRFVYDIDATSKISDFLNKLGSHFGANASIDAKGRIRLTDDTGGDSGLTITRFATVSVDGAKPFGGDNTVIGGFLTTTGVLMNSNLANADPVKDATKALTSVYDQAGVQVTAGTTFTFSGTAVDGTAIVAGPGSTYTVAGADTVQTLLDYLSDLFADGTVDGAVDPNVTVRLGADGTFNLIDNTGAGNIAMTANSSGAEIFGVEGVGGVSFAAQDYYEGQINVTTSKRQIDSTLRGLSTNSGTVPAITASTLWSSVFDENGVQVQDGDILVFTGLKGDGTTIDATTAGNSYTIRSANTVQGLLDHLENLFDADASIDPNGRLRLVDRRADDSSYTSTLGISSVGVTYANAFHADVFGYSTPFATIVGDLSTEDGSQQGDRVSSIFAKEALSSSQYASPSTTIFQDQDGFASGFLQSVSSDTDGIITGHYSNGQVLKKAQVALATFNSVQGLRKQGGNIYTETTESGAPITGAPKTNGLGSIAPNSLEQSNVDLGTEFVKLITVQRGFQANSKIITTTDEMLNDLINIKR